MPEHFPRCECIPLADEQVQIQLDQREVARWHWSSKYPRPFLFPWIGPSGESLTRMGHPGAPDHDHHRSIWFAHAKMQGVDFWSDRTKAIIKQKQWLCYEDREEAVLAMLLGWYDGHDPKEMLEQELIIAVRPLEQGESEIELQSTFRPSAQTLIMEKSNFGLLAVRVAKRLSAGFGGGQLTNSHGQVGETITFAKAAEWMDYSGPTRNQQHEGITFFDHPNNPRYPTYWHVRDDGWMGASFCMQEAYTLERAKPLQLRYLLWGHRGTAEEKRQKERQSLFVQRLPFVLIKNPKRYTAWTAIRKQA